MGADLAFTPEAERDLDEAYAWYEERREGTGDDLLGRVAACIEAIRLSPEGRTLCYKHHRRALVGKFPYAIYYRYGRGTVAICGVFHSSRDLKSLRRRFLSGPRPSGLLRYLKA